MSIRYTNDNKLGCHVVYVPRPKTPFQLDFPAHKVKTFKIKVPDVPKFNYEPPAYNEYEKPGPQNTYTNNWQKTATKMEPTVHLSPVNDLFRL